MKRKENGEKSQSQNNQRQGKITCFLKQSHSACGFLDKNVNQNKPVIDFANACGDGDECSANASKNGFFNQSTPAPELSLDENVDTSDVTNLRNASESEEVVSKETEYPSVWSEDQWLSHKMKNAWLDCRAGKLGCLECSNVKNLQTYKTQGLSLSTEWMQYAVTFNGSNREQQLRSLRTKISAHCASIAHTKAVEISGQAKLQVFEETTVQQNAKFYKETTAIFNTAYYIAKSDSPFSEHQQLIQLQVKNGLNLGVTLHSRFSAQQIICHIASEFRKKVAAKLIAQKSKFSVLIDESTTISKLSTLIVFISAVIDEEVQLIFLDLIQLHS